MIGALDMSDDQPMIERRGVVTGFGALLAAGCASAAGEEDRSRVQARAIQPEAVKAADASYSPGLLAQGSRVLFVSGQGPRDRSAEMEVQIRQTFEKIQ